MSGETWSTSEETFASVSSEAKSRDELSTGPSDSQVNPPGMDSGLSA